MNTPTMPPTNRPMKKVSIASYLPRCDRRTPWHHRQGYTHIRCSHPRNYSDEHPKHGCRLLPLPVCQYPLRGACQVPAIPCRYPHHNRGQPDGREKHRTERTAIHEPPHSIRSSCREGIARNRMRSLCQEEEEE